ncbi:MAG: hypothetical protein WD894_12680 [Pirellulales bacterium]
MPTPSKPANQRQRTWRAQAAQPEQRARRRRVFRVLLPVIGLSLLGALAAVLILWFLRPPKLDLIAIAVADYRNPEVPPIAYCYEDLEALRTVLDAEGAESSWNDASTDKIAQLDTALRETSNSHDNVLVYIKAHGVSLNGAAYLLDGSFELRGRSGRLSIDKLLADVAESPAHIKLLVLDTGHLDSDPRMGMLANEFTRLVTKAVAALPAEKNVWVLTSNSLFEHAQVSIKDRRSAFGYYLAEGLKGAADGVLADSERDGLLQLDELYAYVREHVVQYARLVSSDRQSQTPLLLRSGEGVVTEPPHQDLLRFDASEAEETNVAFRGAPPGRTVGLPWHARGPLALALAGNQQAATVGGDAGKAEAGTAASSAGPTQPAKDDSQTPAAAASAAKNDTPAADKGTSPAKQDDTQTAVKEGAKAAPKESAKTSAVEQVVKPLPRPRSPVEQSLFDRYTWLETQQQREALWRPSDYAPDLARLYYESLRGCRQRALAGELFLKARAYQSSLSNKLEEVQRLQRRIDEREKTFKGGLARPSYERDDEVKAAIRLRNDACYLLPLLIEHHALTSANIQPRMQRELQGLIATTFELDRLLQRDQERDKAQSFENWKQALSASAAKIGAHLSTLRGEFEARSEDQKRLVAAQGNPVVALRLADLAQSPLATPDEREELQALAGKAARSFAEVEKQGSAALRRPPTTETQRLVGLGWQRVIDRAELELALLRLVSNEKGAGKVEELGKMLATAVSLTNADSRLGLVRKIDKYLADTYGNVPNALRDQLKSSQYDSWRRAETVIRLADARDQQRIGKALEEHSSGEWSDPIAGVPLKALPEQIARHQLALGNAPGATGGPLALNYKVPQKLAVRFESNELLAPDRLRLKLDYDQQRVQIKNVQGTELTPGRIWPAGGASGNSTREHRVEWEMASLDERGQQTNMTLTWLDENDRELAHATAVLVHPEPKFSQLAVYGQPGTADHAWQRMPQKESYFDVPFADGVALVRLSPFVGHETRYDFRLTNTATHPKKYTAVVYAIPPAEDVEMNRTVASLAMAGETRGNELARNELTLAPGGTGSIPFFASQPPAAKEAAPAADAAKAGDTKTGDTTPKETAPEVSSGLVCVLTEDTQSTDGKTAVEPRRQVIVIQIDTQLPSNYITPRVDYDARTGAIAAVLSADPDRLPPAGAKVEMDVVTGEQVKQLGKAKRETTLTPEDPNDTLLIFAPAGKPTRAEVFLHVDGYPRAFIYELPLDANLPNVERTLLELRRVALPNLESFRIYYPGKVTEPVRFPFSVDMPSRDGSYLARLFVDPERGGEFNPDEDKVLLQSVKDRVHRATLVKPKTAPGMAIQSQVTDFVAMLDLRPYLNEVRLRAQLVRREGGREEVLGDADEQADRDIVLYLDGEAPTLSAQGPNRAVEANEKFRVDVYPRDQVTEIDKVEFALKVQPKPDSTDPDERMLVDPQPVPPRTSGTYQLMHAFETPGEQSLWFQTTDKSGNKSEPRRVVVTVRKPVPANQGGQPAVAQFGQIYGRAVLPEGARGKIEKVVLTNAQGQVDERSNLSDGGFSFDKVKPGEYTLEAHGTVSNTIGKPVPTKVVVEPGKRAGPIKVPLGR